MHINNPVAIVQARMGSTRLPSKVLKPLAGRPVLWHVIDRLRHSVRLKDVVVATTINQTDDMLVAFCETHGIRWFRGSEQDVLDRYYQAARQFGADPVVRITADCPVIDPTIVDEVIDGFFSGGYDYYRLGGEFPDGLDCEVFSFKTLKETWENARLPSEREHVCPYMEKHPEKYHTGVYEKFTGLGHYRWTIDEEADLRFLDTLYERLYNANGIFLLHDILNLLEREPWLQEINTGITRNEGYLKSLAEDEKRERK